MAYNQWGAPPPYHMPGYPHPNPPPPAPGAYAYVPAPVMFPVYPQAPVYPPAPAYPSAPAYPPAPVPPTVQPEPSYIQPPQPQPPPMHYDPIEWVPATGVTASSFAHRALVAGKEGWDGSPLWVIRAHHSGEFIPGKLAVKHRSAYVPHVGKEVPVHNFEILCVPEHLVYWAPASNGEVPPTAIIAGNTHSAEPLYICRVKHKKSITPGKVHPSHGCAYISFGGSEVRFDRYEVLCKTNTTTTTWR